MLFFTKYLHKVHYLSKGARLNESNFTSEIKEITPNRST